MKTKYGFIPLVAVLLMSASCSPAARPDMPSARELLHFGFTLPGESQRKSSGTSEADEHISRMDLFVFDDQGVLDQHYPFTLEEIAERSATVSVRTGLNTVWLVANVPFRDDFLEGLEMETQLKEYELVGFAGDLPMSSCLELNIPVGGLDDPPAFELGRLVSRIVLSSVTNALPWPNQDQTLHLYGAVLCNVAGTHKLSGPADPPAWLNREGTRDHRAGQVIGSTYPWYYPESESQYLDRMHLSDGSGRGLYALCPDDPVLLVPDREAPGLSACFDVPVTHGDPLVLADSHAFYAFPNACPEPNSGWHDAFVETATVLLVVADIGEHRYWYPVPLTEGLAANREYVINLTVTGLGNDEAHWFDRLEKTNMTCSVDVAGWHATPEVNETI